MDRKFDIITVSDEQGSLKELSVKALFDMDEQSFALLSDGGETVLMRIEQHGDTQELVGISDPVLIDSILDAYEIATMTGEED